VWLYKVGPSPDENYATKEGHHHHRQTGEWMDAIKRTNDGRYRR
jgi:hypothetical protein